MELINNLVDDNSVVTAFNTHVLKHHLKLKFYDHTQAKALLRMLFAHTACKWEPTADFLNQEFARLKQVSSHYIFQESQGTADLDKNFEDLSLFCFEIEKAREKWKNRRHVKIDYSDSKVFHLEDGLIYKIDFRSPVDHPFYASYFKNPDKVKTEEKKPESFKNFPEMLLSFERIAPFDV